MCWQIADPTANDTLTVAAFNPTGSAVDLTSGTLFVGAR